ncbi:MAG TPA: DNA internalization-related competence protein ComEC/Rec2 [Vicinamibacterales bacterium]|nr:DNA internalization-related competence protein ComEC/Rec2 [Vicinamibacterales bacterium]
MALAVRSVIAIPSCALLGGAALGLLVNHPSPIFFDLAFALTAASVAIAWKWSSGRFFFTLSIAQLFFVGGVLLGADAWQRAWRPPLRTAFEENAINDEWFTTIEGTLRADASPTNTGVSLSVDVFSCPSCPSRPSSPSGVILTVVGSLASERIDAWRAGRRIRVPATLRRPSRYLDPGVADNERALARRGTTLVGSVKSGALVEVLERGSWIDETLATVRAFSRHAIADAVGRWDARAAAIVAAIVIGDRAGLDPDVQRRLQEAGTYHVIAISGGNIAILAGLLLGAFRFAGWLGRAAMVSSIVLLIAYAMLVGGGASVDRATLMAVVYFAGRAFDQRSPPLNALALVAGLLVATDPLSVVDPAFVLTFGATLAILAATTIRHPQHHEDRDEHEVHEGNVSKHVLRGLRGLRDLRGVRALREHGAALFIASAATETLLFPIGALIFSRVTFAGLGLNFFAIPLMAVAQVAGMLVVPLALVSNAAATAAGWVAYVGAAGLVWSANLVRFVPATTYRIAPPSVAIVIVYYLAVAVTWCATVPASRRWSGAVAAIAALWILFDPHAILAARGDGRLHVTFIDVGQGDSAFVRFPAGRTMLVDAGGLSFTSSFDIGDRIVAPVIRDAGFYRLDYVALSHGDPDHIGGAMSIVREFRPREVWEGIPVPRSEPLTALRLAVQQQGARWANVYEGDHIAIDGVDVFARHPRPADWERQKVRNDDSIVLELRWRDVSIVLTGDIGKAVEPATAASIPPATLRIVKIAHHGSLTSSTSAFVDAMHPQIAVVSVGRGNHFGHPAEEVLQRYWSVGSEIYRTDEDGAVTIDTDGRSVSVHTVVRR